MPQIFGRWANHTARASIGLAIVFVCFAAASVWAVWWSPYTTRQNIVIEQPVPFSHEHHVAGLGLDCRYCHTGAENSAVAGLPSTETCMSCHSQIWRDAPLLQPVRDSWTTGKPIQWNRVHDLPDFVFFNHGIHVQKGIGCSTCHGAVDQMPLMRQDQTLWMKWCIECHRDPERQIRPTNEVFSTAYHALTNQAALGIKLTAAYHIHKQALADCSICHR